MAQFFLKLLTGQVLTIEVNIEEHMAFSDTNRQVYQRVYDRVCEELKGGRDLGIEEKYRPFFDQECVLLVLAGKKVKCDDFVSDLVLNQTTYHLVFKIKLLNERLKEHQAKQDDIKKQELAREMAQAHAEERYADLIAELVEYIGEPDDNASIFGHFFSSVSTLFQQRHYQEKIKSVLEKVQNGEITADVHNVCRAIIAEIGGSRPESGAIHDLLLEYYPVEMEKSYYATSGACAVVAPTARSKAEAVVAPTALPAPTARSKAEAVVAPTALPAPTAPDSNTSPLATSGASAVVAPTAPDVDITGDSNTPPLATSGDKTQGDAPYAAVAGASAPYMLHVPSVEPTAPDKPLFVSNEPPADPEPRKPHSVSNDVPEIVSLGVVCTTVAQQKPRAQETEKAPLQDTKPSF